MDNVEGGALILIGVRTLEIYGGLGVADVKIILKKDSQEDAPRENEKRTQKKEETMTMTKMDIAERIYQKVGFTAAKTYEVVDCAFELMKEALQQEDKVKISGFGNFCGSE